MPMTGTLTRDRSRMEFKSVWKELVEDWLQNEHTQCENAEERETQEEEGECDKELRVLANGGKEWASSSGLPDVD